MSLVLETCEKGVAHLTLNRPEALNALNEELIKDIVEALERHDKNPSIGCIVLYGTERAFVAGADIKAMLPKNFVSFQEEEMFAFEINRIETIKTPIIAAVAGYALGGGCELAMACDMIIAANNAKFGQPEITLATIPGLGGSQRLTRAVGKAKAMDLILTGRHMDAQEAEKCGLVSRIVDHTELKSEAAKMAETIASHSRPAVRIAKKAVNVAMETTLAQGLSTEKDLFASTFALEDRKEGMTAFSEKRKPKWKNS
jgi:enoyl-CoA hydratase